MTLTNTPVDDLINYNEKTGLEIDYLVEMDCLLLRHKIFRRQGIKKEELLEILAKPIPTYEQHFEIQYPLQLEETMNRADPEALSKLNAIVDKYNSLKVEIKADYEIFMNYHTNFKNNIEGVAVQQFKQ